MERRGRQTGGATPSREGVGDGQGACSRCIRLKKFRGCTTNSGARSGSSPVRAGCQRDLSTVCCVRSAAVTVASGAVGFRRSPSPQCSAKSAVMQMSAQSRKGSSSGIRINRIASQCSSLSASSGVQERGRTGRYGSETDSQAATALRTECRPHLSSWEPERACLLRAACRRSASQRPETDRRVGPVSDPPA